ncbi:hypothetical protein NX059_010675 [Plenodomus lindquistii]|nr:hypothetical protein NX059_010675 [Plenodomus lindquistii]
MAPESKESKAKHANHAADVARAGASYREAYQYWGYLFKEDKCGTPLLDRLLKGIAEVISTRFEPSDSPDLTPSQIAAWYRDVGGDYDVLFTDTPPTSIAFIYRSLGAFHSLQPLPGDDGYSSPIVPALKKQGFVTWQTIQLLLGPEEHVPFLQRAVEKYDVVDSETGNIFPKILPKECFPDCPDDAMETWYQGVAARLKREADEEAVRGRVADEAGPRTSPGSGDGSSADDKNGAFKYFEDPMYRNARQRPNIMRHVSTQSSRSIDESRTVRLRHMLNPWGGKRKSMPGRYESDSYSDEEATPIAPMPPSAPRYVIHKRPAQAHSSQPPRPGSSTDSDSDLDPEPEHLSSHREPPILRTHRSHDLPPSQPDYFPDYEEARRYSHQNEAGVRLEGRTSTTTSTQPAYRPTTSPLFATQVAQAQARKYNDHRPALPPRTSYRPIQHGVRWGPAAVPVSVLRNIEPVYTRERERGRDHRNGDGTLRNLDNGGSSSNHARARRRRSTEDAAYPRERERDTARTRSHDRVRDEWAEGADGRGRRWRGYWDDRDEESSREDSRSQERNREHKTHSVGGQILRFLKDF